MAADAQREEERVRRELAQCLAPEYVRMHVDSDGRRFYFITSQQAISLANEIFGAENWGVEVRHEELHSVAETPNTDDRGGFVAEASSRVRVARRTGAFHEDTGFSTARGASRADAIGKAKAMAKAAATKRALRHFGQALGNCFYDAEYIAYLDTLTLSQS